MRKLIIVCVLLLIVVPVFAQDATAIPLPEVTAEPGGIIDRIPPELVESFVSNYTAAQWLIIGVLLVAVMVFGSQGMLYAYRGASPLVQRLMAEAHKEAVAYIVDVLRAKKEEAAANDIDWDDEMWEKLYDAGVNHREQLNQFFETLKQTPPQEPPQVLG